MTTILRTLWALSLALIVGLVGYLIKTGVSTEQHEKYLSEIQHFQQSDMVLSELVLQVNSGQLAHYDSLAGTVRELEKTHRTLQDVPTHLPPAARLEVLKSVNDLGQSLKKKRLLIETLKTETAVLKNSLSYFPFVATDLAIAVDAGTAKGKDLAARLNALVRDVLVYNLGPNNTLRERTDQYAKELESLGDFPETPLGVDLELLLAHARVILDRRPIVENTTREIAAVSTRAQSLRVEALYGHYYNTALSEANSIRTCLFLLALLAITAGAGDVIVKLRASAAALEEAGKLLKEANQALREEQAKEKELGELKSRFVSMASHEFRTPLSVILSSSELLEAYGGKWTDAKKKEHYGRIRTAIRGMTELLDEVLLIGKADAGLLKVQPTTFDLHEFCKDLAEAIQLSAGAKHEIQLRFTGSGEFEGDERLIRHALTNLLSNAVKYSPDGGRIDFRVDQKDSEASFEIQDQGIGILTEDVPRLFDSFHRGRNVGEISGTGLGLAVVKKSVDAHSGTISVETEQGKGTVFRVILPTKQIVGAT